MESGDRAGMKIRIPRQEIRRILGGRYENLHKELLGIDISELRLRKFVYLSEKFPVLISHNILQSATRRCFLYVYYHLPKLLSKQGHFWYNSKVVYSVYMFSYKYYIL